MGRRVECAALAGMVEVRREERERHCLFLGNNCFGMGAGEGGANLSLLVQSDGRDKSDGGESGGCVCGGILYGL